MHMVMISVELLIIDSKFTFVFKILLDELYGSIPSIEQS